MQIAVHDFIPQFVRSLTALKAVLAKGRSWADAHKVEFTTLTQTRLVPDQFALGRQVQIATDNAKGCAARLAGVEPPKMEDKEQTFEEFMVRIDRTVEFLKTIKPEQLSGYESRKVSFPYYPGKYLDGRDYLVQYALPNFYFHVATAYSILRASGVDVGKADYMGDVNWKDG